MLTEQEKIELLQTARRTLEAYLRERRFPSIEPVNERLRERGGAFVTLEAEGTLRGCIGHMTADRPLHLTVQEMAIQAATEDPRFPPVSEIELRDIRIEISALSPMEPLPGRDLSRIEVGRHGLVVSRGSRRGVLLPQVAVREGWNAETFLAHTCRKAGLSLDAWLSVETMIEIFEAEVFSEADLNLPGLGTLF